MTHYGLPGRPQRMLRLWGLLVGALLLGLLGMHGLGPVPGIATASGHHRMAADSRAAGPMVCGVGQCGQDDHGDGHVDHASGMCVSASIAGPPSLPAPLPGVVNGAEPTDARTCGFVSGPASDRAPPSLSELQLLRI
ncbi:DUF6153 family protein [Streptomyces ochraceiscleroticus]|uniref:DUF6153 family protein n=1 Tax=Streptomyces ochraceiscleroticus TaxID=47761 RepID=A0ABW1MTE0_9ACTN|nr:DUF6153 family protein [Streptomyces ochraceiscleroticus]